MEKIETNQGSNRALCKPIVIGEVEMVVVDQTIAVDSEVVVRIMAVINVKKTVVRVLRMVKINCGAATKIPNALIVANSAILANFVQKRDNLIVISRNQKRSRPMFLTWLKLVISRCYRKLKVLT